MDENMKELQVLPEGWRWVAMKEVCELNPRRPAIDRSDSMPTTFVPMEAVDDVTGKMDTSATRPYSVVKKGYTYFQEGDVVFSKITPCMQNGKHAIAHGLLGGIAFGTTEFHVIRPGPEIDAHWLHSYLRRPEILREAERHFTGAVGQRRVPISFLEELEIPLPPLPEQKRIAAILTERLAAVERARKASEARLEAARALPTAYLREIFESGEARGWKKQPLGELVSEFRYGTSNKSAKSGYLTLRIPNIIGNDISLEDLVNVPVTDEEVSRLRLMDGDVLFVRTNGSPEYIARSAVFRQSKFVDAGIDPEQIIYASYLIRARLISSRLNPLFLQAYLRTREGREAIFGKCKTTAGQYNINTQGLGSLEIPVPPMALQDEIVNALGSKFSKSTVIVGIAEQAQEAVEALSASLLRQAFSGAL